MKKGLYKIIFCVACVISIGVSNVDASMKELPLLKPIDAPYSPRQEFLKSSLLKALNDFDYQAPRLSICGNSGSLWYPQTENDYCLLLRWSRIVGARSMVKKAALISAADRLLRIMEHCEDDCKWHLTRSDALLLLPFVAKYENESSSYKSTAILFMRGEIPSTPSVVSAINFYTSAFKTYELITKILKNMVR